MGQLRRSGVPSSRVHLVGIRSFAMPCRLTRRGLGRLLRLVDLLDENLVIRLDSQTGSAGTWSSAFTWQGPGRLPRLAALLGGDLVLRPCLVGLGHPPRLANSLDSDFVVRSALQTCSTRTWSSALTRRLARQGLGLLLRLADFLGGDLVVCSDSRTCSTNGPKRGYEPYLGYPVPSCTIFMHHHI